MKFYRRDEYLEYSETYYGNGQRKTHKEYNESGKVMEKGTWKKNGMLADHYWRASDSGKFYCVCKSRFNIFGDLVKVTKYDRDGNAIFKFNAKHRHILSFDKDIDKMNDIAGGKSWIDAAFPSPICVD